MNTETSAGGIVVYKSQAGWLVLLMKDMKNNWTFPKGKREDGEDLEETAIREIEEEVGMTKLRCIAQLSPTTYWYTRGKSIKKTVHYFLFFSKTKQTPNVQKEEGISEATWMTWSDAKSNVGYPKTNAPLLSEAQKFLRKIIIT